MHAHTPSKRQSLQLPLMWTRVPSEAVQRQSKKTPLFRSDWNSVVDIISIISKILLQRRKHKVNLNADVFSDADLRISQISSISPVKTKKSLNLLAIAILHCLASFSNYTATPIKTNIWLLY